VGLMLETVTDMTRDQVFLKVLAYGDSGSGKTHLITKAPNPAILLLEPQGLTTVLAAAKENPSAKVVRVWEVAMKEGRTKLSVVMDFFKAAIDGTLAEAGVESVCIDTLDELQKIVKEDILARKGNAEANFTMKDFGTLKDRMRKVLQRLRDMPYHVFATCHADVDKDEETGARFIGPLMEGSISKEMPGYFSAVGYTYTVKNRAKKEGDDQPLILHKVMFQSNTRHICKPTQPLRPIEDPEPAAWVESVQNNANPKPEATTVEAAG